MKSINRKEFIAFAETLGKARQSIDKQIGDTNKKAASLYDLETALIRLKGSILFNNDDIAKDILEYNSEDNINLALFGASVYTPTIQSGSFATPEPWNPSAAPPCLEGWDVLE